MVSTTPPRIRHSQSALDGQLQQQQPQYQASGDSNLRTSYSSTGHVPARKSPDHASLASASSHSHSRVMRKKSFEKLPLKKTLSSHLPRVVAVGGGAGCGAGGPQLSNPYGEWSHDSVTELQVDPAIYDLDYDDVSEAGSDFTEDYSRHKAATRPGMEGMAIPRYTAGSDEDDDDDHSSLSSAGSFADEFADDDDWSASSSTASSAVDSRVLQHHKEQQAAGHSTAEVHLTPISIDVHLLEDHTEFSVEEDPLFNMSGALKQFDMPALPTTATTNPSILNEVIVKDNKEDDQDDNDADEWSDEDPHESLAPSEPSRIWKETPDGRFVPLILQPLASPLPPPPPAIRPRRSVDSHRSSHSEESDYSVESFAGERTPPSKRKGGGGTDKDGQKRRTRRSQDHTTLVPLQPDAKLRFDTSDDEDEGDNNNRLDDEESQHVGQFCSTSSLALSTLEEVLVFSDDEKEQPTKSAIPTKSSTKRPCIPTKAAPPSPSSAPAVAVTDPMKMSKDVPIWRSESPNPVVPTPISILSQSLPMRHWDNVAIDDQLHYSVDFTRIRISPHEYRAPLKDHSKRSRKSKKSKDAKKTTTTTTTTINNNNNTKKKSPKKSKVKEGTSSRSVGVGTSSGSTTKHPTLVEAVDSDVESVSSTERNDNDPIHRTNNKNENVHDSDNASVTSQESLDSMDAAGINNKNHNSNTNNKREGDKKSKKADKKKRKKDKIRKRGRRADYEETLVDATSLTVKQASAAVADRVEAIFTNLQVIYDKTLREEQEQQQQQQQQTPKMASPEMEQEIISFLESNNKPEKIRVRSKASEAVLEQQQNDDKKSTTDKADSSSRSRTKSRTRSKSRSRSVSKDPTKSLLRSRSKSKEPTIKVESTSGRSRSKSQLRSKSMDDAESFFGDSTIVRRKLKKEMSGTQEQLTGGGIASQVKDSRTNSTKVAPTKKEKSSDKASRRSRSPKPRTMIPTKDPAPATESPLRLQDFIDDSERGSIKGISDSFHPQMSRESSKLSVTRTDVVLEEPSDPKSKLEWFQARITELEQSTKDKVTAMKEDFDKRRAEMTTKVMAEKQKTNAIQAILLLHKIKVNHYHESGRVLKKELQSAERHLKQEMVKCSELTLQAQEWQSKTMIVVGQIQQMAMANAEQSRLLEQYRIEFQEVQDALWNEHQIHATQIGDFEEYKLDTKTPLFRQWRQPTQAEVDMKVLRDSYALPRSSIFYNVLEDDECRLLFKR